MVDAPGKIENKIVDILVTLRSEGNVISAFYRFFHKEVNAENRKLLPLTQSNKKYFKGKWWMRRVRFKTKLLIIQLS
jgi:hypothetical protein